MNTFFQFLARIGAISGFTFIFILATIWLQPSKIHKRRKVSTAFLKYSYLFYLAAFLGFIYFLLFAKAELQEYFDERNYFLSIFAALVPTGAILVRRKFHKYRSGFNLIFSILNIIIVIFLLRFFYKFFIYT